MTSQRYSLQKRPLLKALLGPSGPNAIVSVEILNPGFDKDFMVEKTDNLTQEEGIPMAIDSMRRAYARDEIREMIEAREKAERDDISRLNTARKEGLEMGRKLLLQQLLQTGFSKEELLAKELATSQELEELS